MAPRAGAQSGCRRILISRGQDSRVRDIITIATHHRETLVDITEPVRQVVNSSGVSDGIVTVYAQGATAAITEQISLKAAHTESSNSHSPHGTTPRVGVSCGGPSARNFLKQLAKPRNQ